MNRNFLPGDKIIKTSKKGDARIFTVEDPPYTRAGKLRIARENGTVRTTWWTSERNLPKGYTLEPKSLHAEPKSASVE